MAKHEKKEFELKRKIEWKVKQASWIALFSAIASLSFFYLGVVSFTNINSDYIRYHFYGVILWSFIWYLMWGKYPYFKTKLIIKEV